MIRASDPPAKASLADERLHPTRTRSMNSEAAAHPRLLDSRRERLAELRQRLIAVSLRSRSLRLTRPTPSGALDLQRLEAPNPAVFAAALDILGRDDASPVALCDVEASRDVRELAGDVAALAHAAEAAWSETGARDLAVGFPFLEGRSVDGTWIRAPLLLYPVRLGTTSTGRLSWTIEPLGPPELNESLAHALARLASVRLTFEGLLAHDDDGRFRCDAPTWSGFVHYLRSLGFALDGAHEGPPHFEPLLPRSREEREAASIGAFELRAHVVLGRFPRGDSAIVGDYEELLAGALDDDRLGTAARLLGVDEALAGRAEPITSAPTTDRDGWQVFASDDCQDEALRGTREGGLVVQGPPGTGKSQMIANLIASAIASDRRVLVVCQKRAALDVVVHRLESVGLREHVAVVYDVERDRAAVCEGIARTLGALSGEGSGAKTAAHDLVERAQEHSRALARLAARLEVAQSAFTILAGDGNRPGLAALTERALDDDGRRLPALGALAAGATEDEAHALLPALELVARDCAPLASPHPLAERDDWGGRTDRELVQTFDRIRALADAVRRLDAAPAGALAPGDAAAHHALWIEAAVLLDPLAAGDDAALRAFLLGWAWTGGQVEHGEWARVMMLLSNGREHLLPVPAELVLEKRSALDAWIIELSRLMTHDLRWYRHLVPGWWMRRRLPVEILDRCASLPASLAGPPTAASVRALCQQAIAWQELIAELPSDNPFFELGLRGDLADLDGSIELLRSQHARTSAVHALQRTLGVFGGPYAQMPDLERHSAATLSSEPLLQAALRDRARARLFREVEAAVSALAGDLRPAFLAKLGALCASGETTAARAHLGALLSAEPQALEAARLDARARDLPPWAREFLRQWRPSAVHGAGEDALRALWRAWSELALEGRTAASIEAPLVDPDLLDRAAAELDTCLATAGHGILARFSQRVAGALANGSQSVALRRLGMEVAKKRKRATMRQLVERYWDQGLSSVRPIWFCSPEAVAALFPLRADLFDLVVLDEASQCPVEAALPTLARARRALIAGDDQQMPPAHFFRASGTDAEDERDDGDELALLATDSVLALARVAFPGTVLRWHYRSRHEALIAFSNAAFYGHRLISAPRAEGASDIDGLRWIRVPGVWQDQTNAIEAAKVAEFVAELLCADSPPSVGVIAFNKKQADLILQLIDRRAAQDETFRRAREHDKTRSVVERLFVRNLENVQGDERDIIIVSLGYGPSELGGRVHARFGPLGQEGGEKRLNVAVTRARIGLTVVTSIEPEDLDTSGAKHVGPKLLKTYLAFVRAQSSGDATEVERMLGVAAELGGGKGVTGGRGGPAPPPRVGERVARELADALERAGLRVQRSLGLGHRRLDLAIGRPHETTWRLGIDCTEFLRERDGLTRDVYGPRFWTRLGWRVMRVSPRSWAEERTAVVDRVLAGVAADERR